MFLLDTEGNGDEMKNIIKLLVGSLLLVSIIVGSVFLYNGLSDKYSQNSLNIVNGRDEQQQVDAGGKENSGGGNSSSVEHGSESSPPMGEADGETDQTDINAEQSTEEGYQDDPPKSEEYPSPDFTVLDYSGASVKLSDYKGKPVVINFWATWCYYCKQEMPDFDRASKEYPEVQFLMVNATDGTRETVSKAKQYVEGEGFGFDVFFDTERQARDAYGVNAYPTTYFIDENGEIAAYYIGMISYSNLLQGLELIAPKGTE